MFWIFDILKEDFRAYKEHRELSFWTVFYDPMILAVVMFRISQWLYRLKLKPFAYILTRFNDLFHGIWIGPRVEAGPGLFLAHARGLVVNPATKIGSNCTILQRVTLGGPHIRIGDNVLIGAGAQIISRPHKKGGITIGDNAKIGAGAIILYDVPPNTTMVAPAAMPTAISINETKTDAGEIRHA